MQENKLKFKIKFQITHTYRKVTLKYLCMFCKLYGIWNANLRLRNKKTQQKEEKNKWGWCDNSNDSNLLDLHF